MQVSFKKKKSNVLSKSTILCWVVFVDVSSCLGPVASGLDIFARQRDELNQGTAMGHGLRWGFDDRTKVNIRTVGSERDMQV